MLQALDGAIKAAEIRTYGNAPEPVFLDDPIDLFKHVQRLAVPVGDNISGFTVTPITPPRVRRSCTCSSERFLGTSQVLRKPVCEEITGPSKNATASRKHGSERWATSRMNPSLSIAFTTSLPFGVRPSGARTPFPSPRRLRPAWVRPTVRNPFAFHSAGSPSARASAFSSRNRQPGPFTPR